MEGAMPAGYLLKGLLMGLVFGVPAGAIGVLALRNTLERGFFTGLATGLGSSAADLVYAVITLSGFRLLSDPLLRWRIPLTAGASLVILVLGVLNWTDGREITPRIHRGGERFGAFAASFALAIMNPATLISFFAAYSAFGISGTLAPENGFLLITGIISGTVLWWLGISAAAALFRNRISMKMHLILRRLMGSLLILLGLLLFARALDGRAA